MIDTRRNARPGGPMVHESVRKYICESCARETGAAMGMVSPEEYAELEHEVKTQAFELIALHERLEAAEAGQVKVVPAKSVDEFLAALKTELDALRKPVATSASKAVRAPASDE